jgi:3-isopropylmalate/(R)-2-methylmalate dehydratase small subunit
MEAFSNHVGSAVCLTLDNIDTDAIMPKQFMKSISRTGFGPYLFDSWRFEDEGYYGKPAEERTPNLNFVLNDPVHAGATILITGKNFGCGSSREHAPWALQQYGFKVLIAESFADIFYSNCCKIGLLPIKLSKSEAQCLRSCVASNAAVLVHIDLVERRLSVVNQYAVDFNMDEGVRQAFINGTDEIDATLMHAAEIRKFEEEHLRTRPWV